MLQRLEVMIVMIGGGVLTHYLGGGFLHKNHSRGKTILESFFYVKLAAFFVSIATKSRRLVLLF